MHKREKIFADLLTRQGKQWEYTPKRFDLGDTTYKPDFYLPDSHMYIEVIGTRQAFHANKNKIAKFKKLYPQIRFKVLDFEGNPYSVKDPQRIKTKEKKQIGCLVTVDVYDRAKKLATDKKWSLSKLAETALEFYLSVRKR